MSELDACVRVMKRMDFEILRIAKQQHGVISQEQLDGLKVTRSQMRWRVQREGWTRELPGVWRMGWAESTWMQKVWCASLWGGVGAVISHRTAARLWGLEGLE